MRVVLFILQKEFKQIFRNRSMLPIIFLLPVVQLLVLIHAVTFDIHNLKMVVVDNSRSVESRELVKRFVGSSFFVITQYANSLGQANAALDANEADLAIVFPEDFSRSQVKDGHVNLQLLINSINTMQATLANGYANAIVGGYLQDKMPSEAKTMQYKVDVSPRFWYNSTLDYKVYMFPGIMVVLVTAIGLFLSGMNVVREKELGTMEQLNVTPIRKWQFIVGKILPFVIIGIFEITVGILLGLFVYSIPFEGSVLLMYAATLVYLIVVVSFGLIISTVSSNQQQSMFISWFFMMMFLMMSGLFNIAESMPQWAIWLNKLNPIAYFVVIVRMVMIKGSTLSDVLMPFLSLVVYAVVTTTSAVVLYQKKS